MIAAEARTFISLKDLTFDLTFIANALEIRERHEAIRSYAGFRQGGR
jgi:hypothetical protein